MVSVLDVLPAGVRWFIDTDGSFHVVDLTRAGARPLGMPNPAPGMRSLVRCLSAHIRD